MDNPLRLRGWMTVFALALSLAGIASTFDRAAAATTPGRTFIVSCDCALAKSRDRIATLLRRHGGKILYRYTMFPGFAVTVPGNVDSERFVRAVRRIPAVTDVRESAQVELQTDAR